MSHMTFLTSDELTEAIEIGGIELIEEQALTQSVIDAARYIGQIKAMEEIQRSFEKSFERYVFRNGKSGKQVSFETFDIATSDVINDVTTAHPVFFKSIEEAILKSKMVTALAAGRNEEAAELQKTISNVQRRNPYQDPDTTEEGQRLNEALKNTIHVGKMLQQAKMNVARKYWKQKWREGTYSPFSRSTWQNHDRDGRIIPINQCLEEGLLQRRLGLELIYLPQLKDLLQRSDIQDANGEIAAVIERIENTIQIYSAKENELAELDKNKVDGKINLEALQEIIDDLESTTTDRITHPKEIIKVVKPFLPKGNDIDLGLFDQIKFLIDDLDANGLCLAMPTHRANAGDVFKYLDVERHKVGRGDLNDPDDRAADASHFIETEDMIAKAKDRTAGSFTNMMRKATKDGLPIHEMMIYRRFVTDHIDSHAVEKIDIAEGHNAIAQRGLRLSTKHYGVSNMTDCGILHEDKKGVGEHAYAHIYKKLLGSKQFIKEISKIVPGTSKKRPRLVLKVGQSDSVIEMGGMPAKFFQERGLVELIEEINNARLAGKIDLDIEVAGGEGAGRKRSPHSYADTLKSVITPTVLATAKKHGIHIKYRETFQGGDGAIMLGTAEMAAQVINTQLDHFSNYYNANPSDILNDRQYKDYIDLTEEFCGATAKNYYDIVNDPDVQLLIALFGNIAPKGGSRKLSKKEVKSPHDRNPPDLSPVAGRRAINRNASSINQGAHLMPGLGIGTVAVKNPESFAKLVQSKRFRKLMKTPFMVHDLHVLDEMEANIELFNPKYWEQFPKFDENGKLTVEAAIKTRLDDLVYPDEPSKRIYPRLKRAFRLLKDDFEKFQSVRKKYDFSDIENEINQDDYTQQLPAKRTLIKETHRQRRSLLHDYMVALESTEVHSASYERDQRSSAIKAGMCFDFAEASIFDTANDNSEFANRAKEIKRHAIPLLDMNYLA